ncbi:MAG: FAD-binding domain-containing protein [Hydrogenophaga sp.]|nr:FAD-binding domain-containing protein [Hydrogenophaga sp.]
MPSSSHAARALVWFKRDLRLGDHAPLAQAAGFEACLGLFIIEPAWLSSPECASAHVAFVLDGLARLRAQLHTRGLPLRVELGEATDVLQRLHTETGFTHLLSHEETGPGWTYARDLAVAAWCRGQGVRWVETRQTGVVRRLRDRRGWAARWDQRMNAPQPPTPAGWAGVGQQPLNDLPSLADLGLPPPACTPPPAGEIAAHAMLHSFVQQRAMGYRRALSSPLTAEDGCSRLSAHLAWGMVSLRQVHQATEARIAQTPDRDLAHDLRGFAGRLRWHCHFMQKLEDEPAIEFQNFARHCDGLREDSSDAALLQAWQRGETGYPMVDACMRSLMSTGWLNFRMRALLVSFAAYHLWQHWRPTGLFLARQFLDFEAGIHWSQMQMQSGTTGINTLRIYSPTKQARDHDPQGLFIRRWLPELAQVPLEHLAQPWLMDAATQRASGCVIGRDYPAPVVDERAAAQSAKERLYALRRDPSVRQETDNIQQRHGSRRSGLQSSTRSGTRRSSAKPVPPPQLSLFPDA